MNYVENTNVKISTTSDLSEWVGPNVLLGGTEPQIRATVPTVEPDVFDFTDRLYALHELEGFPNGYTTGAGGTSPSNAIPIYNILRSVQYLQTLLGNYSHLSYDTIQLRFTLSDPKSMVGGILLGWYPYVDWFDKNPEETMIAMASAGTAWDPYLANFSPNTQLATFGQSNDYAFTIPWTLKTSTWPTQAIKQLDNSGPQQRSPWGEPVLWWKTLPGAASLVETGLPAYLKIFVSFKGLKFYGPGIQFNSEQVVTQSGLELAAVAEVASTLSTAAGTAMVSEDIIDRFIPKSDISESAFPGTYDQPKAVQMAYYGDTTSCDFPLTSPIFSNFSESSAPPVSTVLDFLKRPQYIGMFESSDTFIFQNDPATPFTLPTTATWFRFFAMLNRYWRGTIEAHFIVAGHPLVEVEFTSALSFRGANSPVAAPSQKSAAFFTHTTIFPGSKHIVVPLPFLSTQDYLPVYDAYPGDGPTDPSYTTICTSSLRIVSFVTPVTPVIPVYVFLTAASDFAFYQPIPPGLYNVEFDGLESQCGLPFEDQKEVTRSRAALTADPGTMTTLPTLYDYMKIWSRCVPFNDYDNEGDEEPIPDANVGFTCASWYPPVDRTEDLDANNSWYFTLDYVALLSSIFLYYKGAMAFKIALDLAPHTDDDVVYVSLGDPVTRAKTHCPFPQNPANLPSQSNFGTGTVVTPMTLQPLLEVSIPYRGDNLWSYSVYNAYTRPFATIFGLTPNAAVNHNIILQDGTDMLCDAMFRKISPNFSLGIEYGLPPFTMWAARGFDWSALPTLMKVTQASHSDSNK